MKPPQTYLFYDLETTGLSKSFDQVVQFAAIRTDEEFHELEHHEIIIKLRPDVVPSPGAMTAHCIPLTRIAGGVCEYDAAIEIHSLMNEPGTISTGYNTLRFDDEFLRFMFYRNLLPPYTHQYANHCGRFDLLPIVTVYWLFKTKLLEWPELEGKISLKLEHLKETNQLMQGTPHDAMIDVKTSIELARRLSNDNDSWQYLLSYFNKGTDLNRFKQLLPISDKLPECYKFGLLVSVEYGFERQFQAPVVFIGNSNHYPNQTLWLRLDLPELQETTKDNIGEKTWAVRKKFSEPGILLPPKERYLERLSPERAKILAENKKWLAENLKLLQKIARHYCDFKYTEIPDVDVDGGLYQVDFMSHEEAELARRFHTAKIEEKWGFIDRFSRTDVRELCQRLMLRNYPKSMPPTSALDFDFFQKKMMPTNTDNTSLDYRGQQKRSATEVLHEIETLQKEGDLTDLQTNVLAELKVYVENNFSGKRQLDLL